MPRQDQNSFDTQDHSSYTHTVIEKNLIKKDGTEGSNLTGKHSHLVIFLVLIITAIVFFGSLKLEWTNWDDNLYVYENPLVREGTLKEIFTTPADYNTYNPLVISSFALEWKLVKDKPFLYHLDNVLLHLFCTALVWLFFRRMGLSIWWSGFAALLFGIHPMRVESVAWITERKDLLYALFYLIALLTYIHYIVSGKSGQLLLAFIFFILSLLSKVQAVTLPLVLVLLDWYFQRKISLKVILEKIVFFGGSLAIGLLSIILLKKFGETSTSNGIFFFDRIILSGYSYAIYILKSVFPYVICACYPIPASLNPEHWIGAAIAVMLFVSAITLHKNRFLIFGLLFFTFNIFSLLPFVAVGHNFLNDRFTYIAYIGLFFVLAMGMQQLYKKDPSYRLPIAGCAVVLLAALCVITVKNIPVWKNSETLWTDVIEKYPRKIPVAYLNRGHYLYTNNQSNKALDDFNMAIELNPDYSSAYLNRSLIYLDRNDNEKALHDYNRYVELLSPYDTSGNISNPPVSDALGDRGVIYFKMGQYEKALVDFNMAIRLNPDNITNYSKRAFAYMQLREYDKAIRDFGICHQSDPDNSDIINNRGVCYLRSGDFKSALDDFNKAILINVDNPSYYTNRASVYYKMGHIAEARQDLLTAEKMNAAIDAAFGKKLQLR